MRRGSGRVVVVWREWREWNGSVVVVEESKIEQFTFVLVVLG